MKTSIFSIKFLNFLLPLFIIFIVYPSQAQLVSIPQEVKFKIGDDMGWANPSLNDTDWGKKLLGTSLKETDQKENIYAWFRIKIFIPSSMKTLAGKGHGMHIFLGKIDDIDQTYFNGKLIGQTGTFPPNFQTKWQEEREYDIPVDDVRWDKENVIAVRIFSPDSWIGMYQGPYKFGPVQWSDFITVQHSISETANKGFITKIKFKNNKRIAFEGTIKYKVTDIHNNELFAETKPVQIQSIEGFEKEIEFADYKPGKEDVFKVCYSITENSSGASICKEQLYLADKQVKIEVVAEPKPVVENKIRDRFTSVPFQDQKQRGYLGKRMNQNLSERLMKLDEEGTLDGYLERPGHHPWAGEHIGKYLETACNVWRYTGDAKLKSQMDRLMYQLVNSQMPDGYLGTYAPEEYWTSWDVWSHKYNLYGLLAYYTTTGYKPALEACKKIGDLLCTTFGNKPGQRDIILAGTHVGMAATSVLDPMVELYKYTGENKYLEFCYYILEAWEQENGPKIISSLLKTGKVTKVGNGKAYEMLSNFVGLANLYRVTGDEKLLKPVLIAWEDIVTNRLYITGTTSSHEYFQEEGILPAAGSDNMGEGCVTTTWVQLNRQLLAITGEQKYVDQIEKSIYNQLLGAENPETGCVSYYTPLMDKKPYTCNITCCQSSVPRGIAMTPYFTFGNVHDVPTLMMYEPASYQEGITATDKHNLILSLQVESNFPEDGNVMVTVNPSQTKSFPIALRVPYWCNAFTATVGSKVYKGITGQNLTIDRTWKPGERIKISFQMPVQRLNGGKSYPGQTAFQRGPQVLAFDTSLNADFLKLFPLETDQKISVEMPKDKRIVDVLPKQWIGEQAYSVILIDDKNETTKKQFLLVPFADASQTGGAVKVWMQLSVKNQK